MVGVSLFSGAGGMDVGFARAGLHALLAVEQWAPAAQTLRANFANVQVLECRVEDVRWELYADGGPVDVVWGGPPCQPFSVAGKGGGQYDPRDGFPAAIAAVRALAPRAFVWENVEALVWRKHGAYTEGVMAALRALGYSVELRRLNAADYGVPQVRRRCFMVGLRSDVVRRFEWPAPTHGVFGVPHTSVRQALGLAVSHRPNRTQADRHRAGEHLQDGRPSSAVTAYGGGLLEAVDRPAPTLLGGSQKSHTNGRSVVAQRQRGLLDEVAAARQVPQSQRLLDMDAPATTLPAAGGGMGTHPPRVAGDDHTSTAGVSYRRLTWQECAALQAFPPDYVWCGTNSARYQQIGNAVPPPLAEVVARQLLEALA